MSTHRLLGAEGKVYLVEGEASFGRDSQCTYSFDDSEVSRRHATVYEAGGTLMLRDDGSANGTFLNGQRVAMPTVLSPGDQIQLGRTVLSVPGAPAPAARPAASLVAAPPPMPTPQPAPAPAPQVGRRSRLPLILGGCAVVGLCLLAGVALVVFLPRTGLLGALPSQGDLASGDDSGVEEALTDDTVDAHSGVLACLGRPDAFTPSQIVVGGVPVRDEAWRGSGFGARVNLVEGGAAWAIGTDPAPNDILLPT